MQKAIILEEREAKMKEVLNRTDTYREIIMRKG